MKRGKQVTGGSTSMASHSSVLACKPVPAMRVPFDLISRFKYRPFLSMRQILLFKLLISIFLPDQVSDLYLTISLPPSVMFLPKQKMQVAPSEGQICDYCNFQLFQIFKNCPLTREAITADKFKDWVPFASGNVYIRSS